MKQILVLLILLFASSSSYTQTLKGTVLDESQLPLIGVNIINLTTGEYVPSNNQGVYYFQKAAVGDTLQFSYIGYETKTISVPSLSTPLDVTLAEIAISLDEIVITPTIDALNLISSIDIQTRPVNSSQDILRQLPGLFIGQHAGGGKAEQIFLRGFDIDHGTDISITVDGLPVNMVSHAHGQGYADLHFVIPETIHKIDFGKGPYYAEEGNFNTAGYVNFKTLEKLDNSLVKLEAGQFNSKRLVGLLNIRQTDQQNAYIASEYISTDGPFDSSQDFNRFNIVGKYTATLPNTDKIGLSTSYFTSKWDASGQIPQRAVNKGLSRFGAIDDTEGGQTSRTNLVLHYDKTLDQQAFLKNTIYYSQYNFELFSNFTFFLNDPVNGDQIKQRENRTIYGFNSIYHRSITNDYFNGTWQAGIRLRHDKSLNNELSRTLNRQETLKAIQLGDIDETNVGAHISGTVDLGKWTINPSLRLDYFNFQYQDDLLPIRQTQTTSNSILSPKLNILYNYTRHLQLYAKTGKGFHSNDTRVVLAQNGKEILPAAYGTDFGFIWKPFPRTLVNAAYWYLFLEQEFVYVGDEGVVEPSGKTRRQGIEVSLRHQPLQWLFWNIDANYTHARTAEEATTANYIPLAPDFTLVSGLTAIHPSGIYGSTTVRHLKNRPANEDNSIIAKGYTVVDFNIGYEWKKLDISFQIQNVLNTEWNETQFATASRLQQEVRPVEEIHFTPGVPFFMKGVISYKF